MRGKRMLQTLRLYLTLDAQKRTAYIKQNKIFADMGNQCSIMDRKIPLYAKLIKLGNNVHLASKVNFVTHDITHIMLNNLVSKEPETVSFSQVKFEEKLGCIEIGDNVFIGTETTILYDVKIGSNVIIGAGSLVNKDIPNNCIAAGVPAKVIGTFESFIQKRLDDKQYPDSFRPTKQEVSQELIDWCWKQFEDKRK